MERNPADPLGYYKCALCGQLVHKTAMTLDHIVPWSESEALRFELSNLQPTHYACNAEKDRGEIQAAA